MSYSKDFDKIRRSVLRKLSGKAKLPICPYCEEPMIFGVIEHSSFFYIPIWICDCEDTIIDEDDVNPYLTFLIPDGFSVPITAKRTDMYDHLIEYERGKK